MRRVVANCLRANRSDFYDEQGFLIRTERHPARRTPTDDDVINAGATAVLKVLSQAQPSLPHLAGEIIHLLQNLTLLPQQSSDTFSVSLIKKGWGLHHINRKGKLMKG